MLVDQRIPLRLDHPAFLATVACEARAAGRRTRPSPPGARCATAPPHTASAATGLRRRRTRCPLVSTAAAATLHAVGRSPGRARTTARGGHPRRRAPPLTSWRDERLPPAGSWGLDAARASPRRLVPVVREFRESILCVLTSARMKRGKPSAR